MSLRDTNPLIDQDLRTIINAYTAGANAQDTEASVYVVFLPELMDTVSFAKNIIKQLQSYNTRSDVDVSSSIGLPDSIAGMKIQNTATTIASADSVGDALKIAAADCIPCEGRILALMNLNPLDDLSELLRRDIVKRIEMLYSFLDLLNNVDIFSDVCDLLRQLNFMCVPDLRRIALMLTLLLAKYKGQLDVSISLPEALIGGLFTPFLSGLNTLLDQYVQMIIAPIECIINELSFQLQKLDIGEGIATAQQQLRAADPKKVKIDKENPQSTEGWIPDIKEPLDKNITKEVQSGLEGLTDYLKQGKQYVDSSLSFLKEQLLKLLDSQYVNTDIKMSAAKNKLHLLRLISLVVSIVNASKAGDFNCGDLQSIDASQKLEIFLRNYITPNTNVRINFDQSRQQITVQSPAVKDTQSNNIAEIVKNSSTSQNLPLPSGSRIVDGQVVKQEATILIKNCLRDIKQQDIDKVSGWISEFEKGEV